MSYKFPDELMFIKNRMAIQKSSDTRMDGKICVITGATSGVGLEAAKRLAKGGAHIVIVARNSDKAKALKELLNDQYNVLADYVIADFSNLDDVRAAASEILERFPRIDVLINSAGIHSTKRTYNAQGIEMVFCVNHLASFLFTQLLLDRMIASAPARIIQINSEGHRFSGIHPDDLGWRKHHYTGLRGYGASKTAQLLTIWEMADRLAGTDVTINAMHPGDVRTNIGGNNGWPYRLFSRNVIWHFLKNPAISGEAIYYLAASPEMSGISGRFFNLTIDEKPASHALDREMGKRVWNLSMEMTGLQTSH